jgi:gluconolactonase
MVDSYWANENCRPSVYRWDPSGRLDLVVTEEQIPDPNGILFSPDYKKLYVISTGKGPGDTGPSGKGEISVFDVGSDNKLSNQKLFTDCVVDGVKCGPDGMRADVDGDLWVSSNAGRAVGYNGSTVWNPAGRPVRALHVNSGCGSGLSDARLQMGRQAVFDATRRPQVGYAMRSEVLARHDR